MPIDASTIYAAAATGALFSGLFTLVTNWMTKRSEERKHMRELAVKVACDHWKFIYDRKGKEGAYPDIELLGIFIMNAVNLVSVAGESFKTDGQIRAHLEKGFSNVDTAQKIFEERTKQKTIRASAKLM